MNKYLPEEVAELLKHPFAFPEKPLFGSVATIQNDHPCVRMMRIYELNQEGCPILLTHTGSNKWKEFVQNPRIAINMVSDNKLLQIVVSGRLVLNGSDEVERYWNMVRPDVRKIYDPRHKVEEAHEDLLLTIPERAPSTFGVACLIPSFWETLQLESEYTKSHRHQFHLRDGAWERRRILVG